MRKNLSLVLLAGFLALPAAAQTDFSKVEIKAEKVADGVYMLTGAGGNIGVSAGADGVFLIDDQYAPLTDKIKAAVAALTRQADAASSSTRTGTATTPAATRTSARPAPSSSRTTTCASA